MRKLFMPQCSARRQSGTGSFCTSSRRLLASGASKRPGLRPKGLSQNQSHETAQPRPLQIQERPRHFLQKHAPSANDANCNSLLACRLAYILAVDASAQKALRLARLCKANFKS
ncbi:unnamed protein product [Polarella glacialis]|uniref:Uncharacterized protein n=1 Tax=Polarella glacialis TaxID=89957 RepID=A0A813GH43_POLGL|nr:unnamed protein product [Polarella glacialis]